MTENKCFNENVVQINGNIYEQQKGHKVNQCKINEAPHNHPAVDCGHSGTEDYPVNKWAEVGPGYEK